MGTKAIDIKKDRTTIPEAVGALVLLVPPCMVDLVDDVSAAVGVEVNDLDWPPKVTKYELVYRVRRVVMGEVELVGPKGERIRSVEYTDKMGIHRRVLRLTPNGVHIADAKSPEELAKHVDLSSLTEAED